MHHRRRLRKPHRTRPETTVPAVAQEQDKAPEPVATEPPLPAVAPVPTPTPTPARPATVRWIVQLDGKPSAPLAATEVKELVRSGKITPETPIRPTTKDRFVPAGKVKGLFPEPKLEPVADKSPTEPSLPAVENHNRWDEMATEALPEPDICTPAKR